MLTEQKKHQMLNEALAFVKLVPLETTQVNFVALAGMFASFISAIEGKKNQELAKEVLTTILSQFPIEVTEIIAGLALGKELDVNDFTK